MFGWFRGRELKDVLNETRKVKVRGIRFIIRKINVLNYLDGSKVVQKVYDTYKTTKEPIPEQSEKKIREHLSEVLVAGVFEPKLSFKEEEGSIQVEKLFSDSLLATELYAEIMNFSNGKKKRKLNILPTTNSENSTSSPSATG